MNQNLEKIKGLCASYDFSGNKSNEYMFTINCVDYFFFNKNIGQVDILDGFVDGAGDGGIDFIYTDDEKIYLIQGKSSEKLTYEDIRNLYLKIAETITKLNENDSNNYSRKLIKRYLDIKDQLDDPEIEIVLFTNTELTEDLKRKINELANNELLCNYSIIAYGKDEIESQVLNIEDTNMQIKEGCLLLDSAKKYLKYRDGVGAIFTIRANSLKELYNRHSRNGLFGYNLREHISQKSVDSAIDKTIKENKDDFWFLNNGITIGCSDYRVDGNKVVLYNFSIINGAQTTTKIGLSNVVSKDHDFSLVCKVIKSENSLEDAFIRNISEASNSQKPIRPRDLKANSHEQKNMQHYSIDCKYPLAIEIKRGVKPKNYRFVPNSWQRVTNEYIGQLLLAYQYQKPGTARSNKADIFGKDSTYNLIFSSKKIKNYSYEAIYDFVKIAYFYDCFKIQYVEKNNKNIDLASSDIQKKNYTNKNSVCNNAKFVTLALLGYFYKREILNIKDPYDKRIEEDNIKGSFTLGYSNNDYIDKLEYLFEFIIDKLSDLYDKNQAAQKLTSHSNFFKTDSTYRDIIIPAFNDLFEDRYDREKITDNIRIFTDK